MKLQRDEKGIPIISAQDIEVLAERFLEGSAPRVFARPAYTPLHEIVGFLNERKLCTFSTGQNLGFTSSGHPRLGRYSLTKKQIAISALLAESDPRYAFTCAHEMGHFYLHWKLSPAAVPNEEGELEIWDSTHELMTYRTEGSNPRSYIEWQANRFAACVLLPGRTLKAGLYRVQDELGIRTPGRIWLDHQRQNQRDYWNVVGRLSELYRVSKAVVEYRVRELGLVDHGARYHMEPIGQVLRTALGQLFHA